MAKIKGDFTLPGESGFEDLTLSLAERWGADVIRDSDGTQLSDKIINTDYGIYSTLCLIRSDNQWAKANKDKLQQNFLMSFPVTAMEDEVIISPLKGYFKEQFIMNNLDDPKEFWQVFDRTTGEEVPLTDWEYNKEKEEVTIKNTKRWHEYTVNFLAIRIWEEISMYNHITNDWGNKEHLMAVEPRHVEVQEHMLKWLEEWCESHPKTTVVRFTSMFYNFAWFWGEDKDRRNLFSDWGSYDFTVNPIALRAFEKEKGYKMTSEDFIQNGKYNATHNAPTKKYREWMDFINEFVVDFGKKCIDIVHRYGKKAYVFYDDSWIGVEPSGKRFKEFGFDGLIKCVFNGFEVRLCGQCDAVEIKELRLHPYLFPTGLSGEPTFAPGGDPTTDAKRFWRNIRRALLRKSVDRIGLGGYLHLVEPFPDFCEYIEKISDEFRMIKAFHKEEKPYVLPGKVAILSAWGDLRSWTCSGHFHENPTRDLMNILESLAGLPVDVEFINFEDIKEKGISKDIKVLINAGCKGSAWSGGFYWKDTKVVETINEWVYEGGCFIGINEASQIEGGFHTLQIAPILGIDIDDNDSKTCQGKYGYEVDKKHFINEGLGDIRIPSHQGVYLIDKNTQVLMESDNVPTLTVHEFGKGKGIYLSSYRYNTENTYMLMKLLCYGSGQEEKINEYICNNPLMECAYFAKGKKLVVINNGETTETTTIGTKEKGCIEVTLAPYELEVIHLD
ncbi:MAG: 1,3-beta-galactosyl-N-acetylhexosamine phosphorylase [Cellulosilyticum sp.]|nr:1,3-beta-galactosyl-N-acetylhexosamine phosphorylase [Cellulosilyticum sp.]